MCRIFPLIVALFLVDSAWGQAVPSREPTSTHIFPAGGKRGTAVKVRVGGECFPPRMNFHLYGPGVTASKTLGPEVNALYEPSVRRLPRDADGVGANMAYPREWDATLTIAADAELGPRYWRASGAFGGTRLRPFLIGDLPEFVESESNSTPEHAERLRLPVVVNGQIAGERDQDYFVFSAKRGEVVVCDVVSARIGSPLDAVVTITDTGGRRMEVDDLRVAGDPVVAFQVPADGDYRLHVANLSFFGGPAYVYRITLSTRPRAVFAFPPGGQAGKRQNVELFLLSGNGTYRVTQQQVTFPKKAGTFLLGDGLTLIAGDISEAIEAKDHRTSKTAMELTLPMTINGRFLGADDEDWYKFRAKKGESIAISCLPFPSHSAAVPEIALFDAKEALLAKVSGAETTNHEANIDWKAPADGVFRLRLRDLQHGSRGGAEFVYRLTVLPAQADFHLYLEADNLNVSQGGKTEIDLRIVRSGDFVGPIDLIATGLPEGVKIEPARIGDAINRVKLIVTAKDDVRPTDAQIRLLGKALIAGKAVDRRASVASFNVQADSLHLTVQHKPLFRITCNEAYQYAHRGTIYPYLMQVERLHGFDGPITIQLCDRQVQDLDGIEVVETVVPPGAKEAKNLIYLPETMHASVQHHCRPYVQGYATFLDKWGQKQTLLAVCEKRCMIRTMPPVAKLRPATDKVVAKPGGTIACKLVLDRTLNFAGAAEVNLVEPAGLKAEKARIPAGATEAVMHIQFKGDVKPSSNLKLRFRATSKTAAGATVVSEASLFVDITP